MADTQDVGPNTQDTGPDSHDTGPGTHSTSSDEPLSPGELPEDFREILRESFVIQTTTLGRRSNLPRTVDTTYVWDGGLRLHLSGYPGRRDWVANMSASRDAMLHTVEGRVGYDVPVRTRVLRDRTERITPLLRYVEHWAARPEAPRSVIRLALRAIRVNRALRLPWWGPFYVARRILDAMPCVELTIVGGPQRRD